VIDFNNLYTVLTGNNNCDKIGHTFTYLFCLLPDNVVKTSLSDDNIYKVKY